LSVLEFVAATLIVTFGAALQGSIGYGMGLVVIPILILIDPAFIPGAMLICAFTLSVLVILREKRALNFQGLQWAIVGRILGAFVAAWLLTLITQDTLILLSGFFVLFSVGITARGPKISVKPLNLGIAGVLSGIMGTMAAIGGPPMALLYQHESGTRIRTSLSGFFIASVTISLVTLLLIGRFGTHELELGMALLPGTLLGYLASTKVLLWLDRSYTRPAVLLMATVSALVVIINQLW
jgi:uncharacterized membrane protein YfcA